MADRIFKSAISRRSLLAGSAGLIAASQLRLPASAAPEVNTDAVEAVLGMMTQRQKIAQLFVIQPDSVAMTDYLAGVLRDIQPGGLIFMGNNIGSNDQVTQYISDIHSSNQFLPPFIAVDQEGGPVTRVPGDPAPGAAQMGYLTNKEVKALGKERGEFLSQFGFDVNLAPVADVAYAANSFMTYRAFGSDPEEVAEKVKSIVKGLQSTPIACAAKHFPGHGRTTTDSHFSTPMIDLTMDTWKDTDALPFKAAVDAGVDMVMIGHIWNPEWDDVPTSLSRTAVVNLRRTTGFLGPIISDDLIMGALWMFSPQEIVERAVKAGIDLLLYSQPPVPLSDLIDHLESKVEDGTITQKRIDANCRRILTFKAMHFNLWQGNQVLISPSS